MKNTDLKIEALSIEELNDIEGGGFGYDVGWFISNAIAGNLNPFMNPAGYAGAVTDYAIYNM